jgi:hypothetical protein
MYHECGQCQWLFFKNYDAISSTVTKVHEYSGVSEAELFDFFMDKMHAADHSIIIALNRQN